MIRAYAPYVLAAALLAAVWVRCDWTMAALCVVAAWLLDGAARAVEWWWFG